VPATSLACEARVLCPPRPHAVARVATVEALGTKRFRRGVGPESVRRLTIVAGQRVVIIHPIELVATLTTLPRDIVPKRRAVASLA